MTLNSVALVTVGAPRVTPAEAVNVFVSPTRRMTTRTAETAETNVLYEHIAQAVNVCVTKTSAGTCAWT